MLTVTAIFAALLFSSSAALGQDKERPPAPSDDACIEKPCGPFVCQARCVASCLDTSLAPTVTECAERFCRDFTDNTPCSLNDTACWKTCGFPSTSDDKPAPPPPDDLHVGTKDGFSSANANPLPIRIEWPATKDAGLYIVEAFPMFGKDPSSNNGHILKNMTTETSFAFERADLCNVYMVRVMAVNGFGISTPRYLVVDAWKPELHFDENFYVRSIRREADTVKVRIDYTPPTSWHPGDVELEDSFVRARNCLGRVDGDLFLSTQPDDDGDYTPAVFINETGSVIELSFPTKIMYSKCLYSFRVSALRTSCNTTIMMDSKTGPGVDFTLNCVSVEDSDCQSTDSENAEDSKQQDGDASGQSERPATDVNPEALEDLENNTLTDTTPSEKTDVLAKGDSKEVVIALNGEALKELDQENTTASSTPTKAESGEVAIAALPGAVEELEDEKAASSSTTPIVVDTAAPLDSQDADKSKEKDSPSPPPPAVGDNGDALPVIVIEPQDANAPQCRLSEFDADLEVRKSSSEEHDVTLSISWMEEKRSGLDTSTPSHFFIRYGPVTRSLIVDSQPDIKDETIVRSPKSDGSSEEELSRVLKVTDLAPNGLYAFQICAMYNPSADSWIAWDMVPPYVVDLSAANSEWRNGGVAFQSTGTGTTLNGGSASGNGPDFVDEFINALNTSFDNAQEAADSAASSQNQDQHSNEGTSDNSGIGVLEVNLPRQPPPILNVDVNPVVIIEPSPWSPVRTFWLMAILALLAVTVASFILFALRRSHKRRDQKLHQFQPTTIYQTPTVPTVASEVKVPIP